MLTKNMFLLAAVVIVVVVVVAAAYYALVYLQYPGTNKAGTTYITTSLNASVTPLAVANASLLTLAQLPYAAHYSKTFNTVYYGAPCNATAVYVVYVNPVTYFAANYSQLNKSVPFAVYDTVYVFNHTVSSATQDCPFLNATTASDFSSYASSNTSVAISGMGTQAVLREFENLTAYGLNSTNSPYIGSMPQLSTYALTFAYNGYVVDLNTWGFYKHMNASQLLAYANYTLSKLK